MATTMEITAVNPRVSDRARASRIFAWSAFSLMFLSYVAVARTIISGGNLLVGLLVMGFWAATLVLGLVANRFIVRAMLTKANGYYPIAEWADSRQQYVADRFATVVDKAGVGGMFDPFMSKDKTPNAFAVGGGKRAICLHAGLIDALRRQPNGDRLIEAVIAHEVGHLKARDTTFFVVLASMTMSFIFLGRITLEYVKYNTLYERDSKDRLSWKTALAFLAFGLGCLLFGYVVSPLTSAAVGRKRESAADMFAANLGYAEDLQTALGIISEQPKTKVEKGNAFIAPLFFSAAQVEGFLSNITRTHPHTHVRQRDLEPVVKGDQGLLPDRIQGLVMLCGWFTLSAIVFMWRASAHTIPVGIWAGATVLAAMAYYVLGMGTEKPLDKLPGVAVVALALGMLAIGWIAGGVSIYALGNLPVLSSPVPVIGSFGRFTLGAWIALPLFASFGIRKDLPSTLADFSAYTALVYALGALWIMFI